MSAQGEYKALLIALRRQTKAMEDQTLAIRELVKSNADLIDAMANADQDDMENNQGGFYLDGSRQ